MNKKREEAIKLGALLPDNFCERHLINTANLEAVGLYEVLKDANEEIIKIWEDVILGVHQKETLGVKGGSKNKSITCPASGAGAAHLGE